MAENNASKGGPEEVVRVRLPRDNQTIGIVEEMLGGGRFRIDCKDGNTRICKISGKFRRRQWIRPGDVVIVEPWEVQGDEKGKIVWKYRKSHVFWLEKKGKL